MPNFSWLLSLFGIQEKDDGRKPPLYRPLPNAARKAEIWAVGGGKGGVGKSFIASNLAILLSKLGNRVLLVDADLGAANLHTFLGIDGGKATLSGFLKGEVDELARIITRTSIQKLDLISGASDALDIADVTSLKITRLGEALRRADYDYIIIDVGPGTSANMLDLFLLSNEGIVLSTPEPTTIENNYRFLKSLFLRKIKTVADSQEDGRLKELLQRIFSDSWPQRVKTVSDILDQLKRMDSYQAGILEEQMNCINISMILNQAKKEEDADIGPSIKRACSDYFGMEINFLGSVFYEEAVSDSIRARKPLSIHYVNAGAVKAIEACLKELLSSRPLRTAPNTFQYIR